MSTKEHLNKYQWIKMWSFKTDLTDPSSSVFWHLDFCIRGWDQYLVLKLILFQSCTSLEINWSRCTFNLYVGICFMYGGVSIMKFFVQYSSWSWLGKYLMVPICHIYIYSTTLSAWKGSICIFFYATGDKWTCSGIMRQYWK